MKVRFEVDTMRQQVLHHFVDYQKVIEEAINNAVTPENLFQQVQKQVNETLAWKIGLELDTMVRHAVRESDQLHKLILKTVDSYITEAAKRENEGKQKG